MHWEKYSIRCCLIIGALFAVGIAMTARLHWEGWDLAWVAQYYTPGGEHDGWSLSRNWPWNGFYKYGEIPGLVIAAASLALFVAARMGKVRKQYEKCALVVVLTVAIGPGLLVNGILKPYWGRARPAEIIAFGGTEPYRAVWQPGGPGTGKSFPCGHCAMNYAIGSLIAFYPVHPMASVCALIVGIIAGTVVGVGRMVQGGHFPTDVVWSGVLVLSVVVALYYVVLRVPDQRSNDEKQ